TLANIGFARTVEPGNSALAKREERDRQLRAQGKPTLPSRLGDEKATNPFLRVREPAVIESANKYLGARIADPVRVSAGIRDWKNQSGEPPRPSLRWPWCSRDAPTRPRPSLTSRLRIRRRRRPRRSPSPRRRRRSRSRAKDWKSPTRR